MKSIALKYVGENGDQAEVIPSKFIPLTFADLFPSDNLLQIQAEVEASDATINGEVVDKESVVTIPIKQEMENEHREN